MQDHLSRMIGELTVDKNQIARITAGQSAGITELCGILTRTSV